MAAGIPETIIHILIALYLFSLGGLFLYGTNCYVMLYLFRRHRNKGQEDYRAALRAFDKSPWRSDPPFVTVQLPLYNERFVIGRLLKAVCFLDYPRERLEIQVLDDSTDDTAQIAGRLIAEYQKQGLSIVHIRRNHRQGFKAGALREGMEKARGELIAIFDADFVPPADFLLTTIPYFCDPEVGMVQARWGHINPEASLLTRAQSVGIDGHFSIEQGARAWSGLFLNFNGTAGIWRRQAIVDAGGWQEDTLTEDMDLSYRAQLAGWQLKYVLDLVCPAELPNRVSAFKSQQFRWAKGSIQTARKLIPILLKASHSWFAKYQAILHMTHYLIHPFMLATVLLSYPLISRLNMDRQPLILAALVILFTLSTFGPSTLYVASQRALYPDTWRSKIRWMPLLTVVGTGIALSNTRAVLEGLLFSGGEFVRTPKSGFQRNGVALMRRESYWLKTDWLPWMELLLGIYASLALSSALRGSGFWLSPFLFFYTCGFLYISLKGLSESLGQVTVGPSRLR